VRSVVIFGAGELGGAIARQLAAADVASQIILVDEAGKVAEGKALDIRQAAPIDRYSTVVSGTSDETAAVGADAVIVADRATPPGSEWQDDGAVALVRRLAQFNETGLILCAGARQMDVMERAIREVGIARHRLVGSAPEALRSAIISMAALEARSAQPEISLTVVGRPPDQIIVPWDDASIAGRRAVDVLAPPAIARLDARLARLWPPGAMTLAAAATRFIVTAATRTHRTVSAFVARDDRTSDRIGMLPVTLSSTRIASVVAPTLSTRDRVRLETALHR